MDNSKKHLKMANKLFAQIEMINKSSAKKYKEEEPEYEGGEEMSLPPEWMLEMINQSLLAAH